MVKRESSNTVCLRFGDNKPRYMLPIHVACAIPDIPVQLIQDMIKAHPLSLLQHTTAVKNTRKSSAESMAKSAMSSVSEGTNGSAASSSSDDSAPIWGVGWLPLHVACYYGVSDQVLQLLLQKSPSSIFCKTTQGLLPIHVACIAMEKSKHLIPTLVEAFPQSIYVSTSDGVLPHDILDATGEKKGDHTLQLLKGERSIAKSISSQTKDNTQNSSGTSKKDISLMMRRSVHSIPSAESSNKMKRSKSMLYQHTKLFKAISTRQWTYALDRMQRRPQEARIWTLSAQPNDPPCHLLPLHLAIRRKAPVNVIRALLRVFPEAQAKREFFGMLPIHVACELGSSLEIVMAVSQDEALVKETCMHKKLPLHLVCTSNACRKDVIAYLLGAYPKAMNLKDYSNHLPYDYVKHGSHPHQAQIKKMFDHDTAYWSANLF